MSRIKKAIEVAKKLAAGLNERELLQSLDFSRKDLVEAGELFLRALEAHDSPESVIRVLRLAHARAYYPWTEDEDADLRLLVALNYSIEEISEKMHRQPSAIRARLRALEQ